MTTSRETIEKVVIRASQWIGWAGVTLSLLLFPNVLSAGTLSLAWDRVTDIDVAGYRLYYGTVPGVYPNEVRLGLQTSYTLSNLKDCVVYHLAVKAFDSAGNLSLGFSNEISGMPKPIFNGITSSTAKQGTNSLNVTIAGTNFDTQARPDFVSLNAVNNIVGPDIIVNSYGSVSCNQIVANISINPGAWVNDQTHPRIVAIVNQPRQASDRGGPADSKSGLFRVLYDERRSDIDKSGRVMDLDFLFWRDAFGSVKTVPPAPPDPKYSIDYDLNGDGVVDGLDLALLAYWHGKVCDTNGCH